MTVVAIPRFRITDARKCTFEGPVQLGDGTWVESLEQLLSLKRAVVTGAPVPSSTLKAGHVRLFPGGNWGTYLYVDVDLASARVEIVAEA